MFTKRTLFGAICLSMVAAPALAQVIQVGNGASYHRPGHPHADERVHGPVIVVKPGEHAHRHHHPFPPTYHRRGLPPGVVYVVWHGQTYAVVGGRYYYRHDGDRYIYVNPPAMAFYPPEINTPADPNTAKLELGTVVSGLPAMAKKVIYDGETYLVDGRNWYLPVKGTTVGQYVVVPNPFQ